MDPALCERLAEHRPRRGVPRAPPRRAAGQDARHRQPRAALGLSRDRSRRRRDSSRRASPSSHILHSRGGTVRIGARSDERRRPPRRRRHQQWVGSRGSVVAVVILFIIFTILSGIRIVRPTHRGLVERLGKYNRYAEPGFHLTIPFGIERMYQVDIREVLVEAAAADDHHQRQPQRQGRRPGLPQGQGRRRERQGLALQRHQLPVPDRQPGAHHAAQHHRHA